ncbi:hypothetical protein M0805_008766 [Coniferiporia weirii]|nr:hypothetical protein M0805_008766 [Coniferiporia weirii]
MAILDLTTQDKTSHSLAAKLQSVFSGEELICTHAGISQYSQSSLSSSACGLAGMNCIRHLLALEREGTRGDALLAEILQRGTMEDIMSICALWTSTGHLEVDEIHKTPLFQASLKLSWTDYGKAEESKFEDMLRQLDSLVGDANARCSSAVVITRPPEIVTCLKIAHPTKDVYVIFDSHPRPAHPDGAAFILYTSLKRAARYLAKLLPVDPRLLAPNSGLQWQAELLGHVSGHFFMCASVDMRMSPDALCALLEANCALLSYKAQENEAKSQHSWLASENDRLNREFSRMDEQLEQAKHDRAMRAVELEELEELREYKARRERNDNEFSTKSSTNHFPAQEVPSGSRMGIGSGQTNVTLRTGANSKESFDFVKSFSPKIPAVQHSRQNEGLTSPFQGRAVSAIRDDAKGKGRASDMDIVLRMQLEYQDEDAALRAQMQLLQSTSVQETFECSICLDKLPLDCVAHVDICGHTFCRECLRQYISSKLDEHKFPTACPCCSTQDESERTGKITETLIQQIGISDKSYSIYTELQMAEFSIQLQCKKCKQSAFVDKREYDEMKVLACPFPRCNYLWCKDCQQEVPLGHDTPPHSCDGSTELKHLMDKRGWKNCPGCKTPTEKIDGCNHMTCCSPGCNTHFCYICGGLIVRSNQRANINAAVSSHYKSNCMLFNVPGGI